MKIEEYNRKPSNSPPNSETSLESIPYLPQDIQAEEDTEEHPIVTMEIKQHQIPLLLTFLLF